MIAHIAGLPAEELLLLLPGGAGLWAAVRLLPTAIAARQHGHRATGR
ncbi:MAG: hypothetical protein M3459_01785 [Actinomycetota bacterium]|nr:hypothetical protein [Actinomycetota bacterium]